VRLSPAAVLAVYKHHMPRRPTDARQAVGLLLPALRQVLRPSASGFVDLRRLDAEVARLVLGDRQQAAAG
jgi:hypothetical protein